MNTTHSGTASEVQLSTAEGKPGKAIDNGKRHGLGLSLAWIGVGGVVSGVVSDVKRRCPETARHYTNNRDRFNLAPDLDDPPQSPVRRGFRPAFGGIPTTFQRLSARLCR
ncbi:hypothetical protein [Paraburkholderia bannensis]|uniref:hypothetical protein n=1 Tax=Paraburkholderia bannensis TaxID=765414 RepID=UPI002ABE3BF0|nr:hypothetical protein [Paraburkholderia bannensis]